MRYFFIVVILLAALPVAAHQPVVITDTKTIEIPDPNTSFAYYGELTGSPQTFHLESTEPFTLHVSVLEPDLPSANKDHGATVYFEGGSEPVAELPPADASWESYFEFFGGDYYLNGPEYTEPNAPAGHYEIEVSSPDNTGKYVLVTGTVEDFSNTSFWATLKEIYKVKQFFDKSPLAILQTPFVYVPLLLLILLSGVGWYLVRRRKNVSRP